MKYELIENKWVRKYNSWDLAWKKIKSIDEKELNEILNIINKITCEKYKKDENVIIIKPDILSKYEIIINRGE